MSLREVLQEKRTAIAERWLQAVLEGYPAETAGFLRRAKDPFANPVGATLARDLPVLLDAVTGPADPGAVRASLEALVKMRSVQDFTASQAVAFVFLLKAAVRAELAGSPTAGRPEEWAALESDIDALALSAFDAYSANRERMCDIRISAMKKRTFILEQMALGRSGGQPEDPAS